MSAVTVNAYARSHTSTYVSDKLRNLLKALVRSYGLDPQEVVDAWSDWVDYAARTWLETGHLNSIVIEFYTSGSRIAAARWEFPVRYDGNGADEMWVDRMFFDDSIAKAKAPPRNCIYRIVLMADPSRPHIEGMGPATLRSIDGLVAREIGTVIATPDIMASARYYR